MSNQFISINSNGGYIGRYYWANTDFHHPDPDFRQGWGQMYCMPMSSVLKNSHWAGSIWVIRAWLKARSFKPCSC